MDDWLVSVVKDGKVVDLQLSKGLLNLDTIKAVHGDCDMELFKIAQRKEEDDVPCIDLTDIQEVVAREGKSPVKCIENGVVYDSVKDASRRLGIPCVNIYASIRRGIKAYGFSFEYFD